jgi:hypothetical protein
MSRGDDNDVRVFPVETRLQRLARRPGGIPRSKALEKAQANVDEIKPGFDDWLENEMASLADLVKQAQSGKPKADWAEALNSHSRHLRDVGTTMDFELLTFIANSLCEMLDAMAAGAECDMESIQCHVDALFLARQPRYRGLRPEQVPDLTSGLRRVVEQVSTSPSQNGG